MQFRRSAIGLALLALTADTARAQPRVSWRDINPDSTRQQLFGTGGRFNGVSATPNGYTFYAASEWGGLYKTGDQGRTWVHLPGHSPMVTWDVEVDPTQSTRVIATSFYDGRVNSKAGINISYDSGGTWSKPATAMPPDGFCIRPERREEPSAFGIAYDPAQPSHIYVGTNCGLAYSRDSGATWQFVDPTPADGADDIWSVIVHHGVIDLCGDDGHRRSTDGGQSWTGVSTDLPLPGGRCSIAASPHEADVLFAVVVTDLYTSRNGGRSWSLNMPYAPRQGRIAFVKTVPRSSTRFDLWLGDVYLYRKECRTPTGRMRRSRCSRREADWIQSGNYAHPDLGDVSFASNAGACPLLVSTDGGVYYNTRRQSPQCHEPLWQHPLKSPHALWLFAMGGSDHQPLEAHHLYAGAQDNGTFMQTRGLRGESWLHEQTADTWAMASNNSTTLNTSCCMQFGRQTVLELRQTGVPGFLRTLSYPGSFNFENPNSPPPIATFGGNQFVIATSDGVFYSADVTATPVAWIELGAEAPTGPRMAVYATRIGGEPAIYLLEGWANGRQPAKLWRHRGLAADGEWERILAPNGEGGFGIVGVDPTDGNRLIVSHLSNGVVRMLMSASAGDTWTPMPQLDALMTGDGAFRYASRAGPFMWQDLTGYVQPTLIQFDPANPALVVAGASDAGVFLSTDRGVTWRLITDPIDPADSGVPHIPRPTHAFFQHGIESQFRSVVDVAVGTWGRGVWQASLVWQRMERPVLTCEARNDCRRPDLQPGTITLECDRIANCLIPDPVPENCTKLYPCPGCSADAKCPPTYRMVFDGLDPKQWDVGLFTTRGRLAAYDLRWSAAGAALTFRPDSALYREGRIGEYVLLFAARPGGAGRRTVVKSRLERVTDR